MASYTYVSTNDVDDTDSDIIVPEPDTDSDSDIIVPEPDTDSDDVVTDTDVPETTRGDIDGSGAAARSFNIRIDDGQTTALQPSSSIVLPSSSTLPVYNLSGQRVTTRSHLGNLRKGVYIVDGKKLIVK